MEKKTKLLFVCMFICCMVLIIPVAAFTEGKIAYFSSYQINVINSDGSGWTNLSTFGASDFHPAWSPDGSKIAFSSEKRGSNNLALCVMNADGSSRTEIYNYSRNNENPAWSPDGTKIAFESEFIHNDRNSSEIFVINEDGSSPFRYMANSWYDGEPAWSPDGTKIAFTSNRDGNFEIYVMTDLGAGVTRLTNNAASDYAPAWSPDGTKIAFASDRDGDSEIYYMPPDGSNITRLTDNPAYDSQPAWSPDGSMIAFYSDRDGGAGQSEEIYVMTSKGTDQTRLTINTLQDIWPSWGPKQTKIGIFRDGFWILDRRGNFQWDGPPGDVVAGFGMAGDIPVVIDCWNDDNLDNIGLFRNGLWLFDFNGNYQWDGVKPGNYDLFANFGAPGDIPVVKDWNGDSIQEIAVYRASAGQWIIDQNGNFRWDDTGPGFDTVAYLGQSGDKAVAGDWDMTGSDNIGVFRDGFWILDYNGNYQWDGTGGFNDLVTGFGTTGDIPIVADWNGDTRDNIGVFRNGFWILDYNGNFVWDDVGTGRDIVAGFGAAGDVPVVKDWNGDGLPEIAVYRAGAGQWIIDHNGNFIWDGTSPGQDVIAILGQSGDTAVAGSW